jgi:hypothetical protein
VRISNHCVLANFVFILVAFFLSILGSILWLIFSRGEARKQPKRMARAKPFVALLGLTLAYQRCRHNTKNYWIRAARIMPLSRVENEPVRCEPSARTSAEPICSGQIRKSRPHVHGRESI